MTVETTPGSASRARRSHRWTIWVGRVLSAVPILILLRSAWMKLSAEPQVAQEVVETFGYPASTLTGIGLLEFACMLLYATPRTAVLGAVLLTGYLGGAVATHVRIGEPFVIPLVLGALIWAGLYLRDEDTRDLVRHKIARLKRSQWESWRIMPAVFRAHVRLYRLLGGRLVGKSILILTTTGRKSGRRRSTPLYFVRDGEDYAIIASNGGEDRYPGWWYNVKANSDVEIQVGREHVRCVARAASGADTPVLFAKLSAVYAGYRRYAEQTERELTIFRLEPSARG